MKDNLEERIRKRLEKMKSRNAYRYFLSHLDYPNTQKRLNESVINTQLKGIEDVLPEIKKLLKQDKKYTTQIWDQTKYSAAYLLLGKAFSNLEAIILLAKNGHNLEMVDLARSGTESVDLAFLLFEDDNSNLLEKWFKGKIIENERARKSLHKIINQSKAKESNLPVEEMKKEAYKIYSLYVHSGYSALLEIVDVFHEDLDFERHAGFHYTRRNLYAVQDLAVKILLQLKNIFVLSKDQENLAEADRLLKQVGHVDMTPEEIAKVVDEYFNGSGKSLEIG